MSTVLVFDSNNLQSLMAAAAIASIRDVIPYDCRSMLPEADHYVWLGVVPTVHYFGDIPPKVYNAARHTAIVNLTTTQGLKDIAIKDVEYTYATTMEEKDEVIVGITVVNTYGSKGLLERALLFFGEDPGNFSHLVYMLTEFYTPNAPIELLQLVALNAKEAYYCLTNKNNLFTPISLNVESLASAEEAYAEYDSVAKVVLIDRWTTNWVKTKGSDQPKTVMTFYEQSLWWFIRRRILRQDLVLRNVSLSATGTIVTSTLAYTHGIRGSDPVIVY